MAKIISGMDIKNHIKENIRGSRLILTLKGIPLGISLVLPGLSFGTTALILWLYDRILANIKNLDLKFFFWLGIGVLAGLLSSTHLVSYLLNHYQETTFAFLFGLILFSTRVTYREILLHKNKISWNFVVYFIPGLVIALYFGYNTGLNGELIIINPTFSLIISGMVSSMAMLLPGLSGATVLVMLGSYEIVIDAVNALNIPLITLFAVGILAGLLIFSWVLNYLLYNYRSKMMTFLTGLILGSALNVLPSEFGLSQFIAFSAGAALVYSLTNFEQEGL